MTDLRPLTELKALELLDLSLCTEVAGLDALKKLTKLHELRLGGCHRVTSLRPLVDLGALASLDLSYCAGVTDLGTLADLRSLASLDISRCQVQTFGALRDVVSRLRHLRTYGTRFTDLHPSVCSRDIADDCAESVRRYLRAVGTARGSDTELKVFVLGNGRAGKTTLLRRLTTGRSFHDIARTTDTTHGVRITRWTCPSDWDVPDGFRLTFWDFGGQDVYHGTHALFLGGPAVFLIVYAQATETDTSQTDGGFTLRNRRLDYWFDLLRQAVGSRGVVADPVLLVQARCDESGFQHPVRPPAGRFPRLSEVIHTSSAGSGPLAGLGDGLRTAVEGLVADHPRPDLPASWAKARDAVRARQSDGGRTLSRPGFQQLCRTSGCGPDAGVVLDALHRMGVLFYCPGLFGDRVVIDQGWVLERIYALFDRGQEAFLRQVRDKHGMFRRSDLAEHVWKHETMADQRLYLSYMVQCGVCFRAADDHRDDYDGLYIAPDLLDDWGEREVTRYAGLQAKDDAGATATYALLHDGIARGFLARIGRVAGDRANYWRYGCHFHDAITGSEVLVRADGNAVRIAARDGDAAALVQTLIDELFRVPSGQPPTVAWHGHRLSPTAAATEGGAPERRLVAVPAPPTEEQVDALEALVVGEADRRKRAKLVAKLQTYSLVGYAYRAGGVFSLADAAKVIQRLFDAGRVPTEVSLAASSLTKLHRWMVRDLGVDRLLEQPGAALIDTPGGKSGQAAYLTAAGERSCQLVDRLLARLQQSVPFPPPPDATDNNNR